MGQTSFRSQFVADRREAHAQGRNRAASIQFIGGSRRLSIGASRAYMPHLVACDRDFLLASSNARPPRAAKKDITHLCWQQVTPMGRQLP